MCENFNQDETPTIPNCLNRTEPLLRAKIWRLEKELNYIRFQLQQRNKELADMNTTRKSEFCEMNQDSLYRITRERDDLLLLVTQLNERLEQSEQYNQELFDQLNKYLQELQLSKLKQREYEIKTESLTKEMHDWMQKIQNLDRMNQNGASENDDFQTERSLLAFQLNQLRTRLTETEFRAQTAETKIRELEEELTKKKNPASTDFTNEELNVVRAKMLEDKAECDRAKWELSQLRNHINEIQQVQNERIQQLNNKLINTQERATKAETELMKTNDELTQLIGKYSILEKETANTKKSMATVLVQHSEEVANIIKTAELREKELKDRLSHAQTEHETKIKEANHLLTQYRVLIMRIKDEYLTGIEQFDLAIKGMTDKHERLMKTNKTTKFKLSKSLEVRHNLERETGEQIYQNEAFQMQITQLQDELSQKIELISHLEYRIDKLISDRKTLAQELERVYKSHNNTSSIGSYNNFEKRPFHDNIVRDILKSVRRQETHS